MCVSRGVHHSFCDVRLSAFPRGKSKIPQRFSLSPPKKRKERERRREEKSLKFEKAAVASRRVAGGKYEDGRHGRRREDGS